MQPALEKSLVRHEQLPEDIGVCSFHQCEPRVCLSFLEQVTGTLYISGAPLHPRHRMEWSVAQLKLFPHHTEKVDSRLYRLCDALVVQAEEEDSIQDG